MQVIKRDHLVVDFNKDKIINAITRAMDETELGVNIELAIDIAENIEDDIKDLDIIPTVETIQNMVEEYLMDSERKDVAKRYILYRQERTKLREHPQWEMDELQRAIWENKYRYNGESFEGFLNRVSNGNEHIKKLMLHKKLLPAGRILAGRGTHKDGKKITLSNCFVLPSPQDNIESIFDTAKYMARTYSYGGGVGIDISNLRPKKSKVNNAAKTTSGAISFMDLYSLTTELIGQSGRRGALMITLDCSHPDLIDFINCKTDLNKVTKANISIKVSDEFMNAVLDNADWKLHFIIEETGEVIEKTIKAQEIYHIFCKMDWNYAEPSLVYWSKINNWNLLSEDDEFEYVGLNPCFTGDMKLLTTEGYKTFEELCDTKPTIINENNNISQSKIWCSGEKEVIQLNLSNKQTIKCTPNHVFKLTNGDECEAKDLKNKRIQLHLDKTNTATDLFVKLGFIQGDGSLGRLNSETHKGLEVNIGHKDNEIFELFGVTPIANKHDYYLNGYNDILIQYGFDGSALPDRVFPITYTSWTKEQKLNFLKGCYSANGSVIKTHRVAYKTTSKVFALQLQKALNEFGITANLTTNKSHNVHFSNGDYICKESYDININKINDIKIFYENIGFMQRYKMDDLIELIKCKSPMVLSIKNIGIQKVYDFTEPLTHWGVVEGLIAHNCAEEPLPEFGSCNLISLNLSEFVINPFTKDAHFDYERFNEAVKQTVIYMNDLLDEAIENNLYPLEQQKQSVIDWRQIGIGIMGIADMLIKMGVKYGDKKSLELCDKIGFEMINSALQQSAWLAKQDGTYEKYKKEAVLKSEFLKYNAYPETMRLIEKYGLRNSQVLTIAPTGSLSTMLGISGGIEPIYQISYTRKTESLHDEDTYYKVFTPIAKEYMNKFNIKTEEELPDIFVTTNDLNYFDRVDMQAVWQKHIDASISSTVNLPFATSVKQVEDLYLYAWEKGLKGITIFRDGCKRSGILTTDKTNEHEKIDGAKCLECGATGTLIKTGGCVLCVECGHSPCS
jgi:ribonucleotide reductase alpha subunit